MKINEIYSELLDAAKKAGVTVRKENGKFRSGNCLLNDKPVIVINKMASIEHTTRLIADMLSKQPIDNLFLKPAVREFIENESNKIKENIDVNFDLHDINMPNA